MPCIILWTERNEVNSEETAVPCAASTELTDKYCQAKPHLDEYERHFPCGSIFMP